MLDSNEKRTCIAAVLAILLVLLRFLAPGIDPVLGFVATVGGIGFVIYAFLNVLRTP